MAKQQRFDLGGPAKKRSKASRAARKAHRTERNKRAGKAASRAGNRARSVAGKARIQMSGRIPPIRGRRKGSRNHPAGSSRSRAQRAGSVLGKQVGHAAAGFSGSVGSSYRLGKGGAPRRTVKARSKAFATSKHGKIAIGGLAGAVAVRGAYGLAKARAARPVTNVNVAVAQSSGQPQRKRRGILRRRRRVRRDRYGRFR